MADDPGSAASAKLEAIVYGVDLAGFLVLLGAAAQLFGLNAMGIAFSLFIVVVASPGRRAPRGAPERSWEDAARTRRDAVSRSSGRSSRGRKGPRWTAP